MREFRVIDATDSVEKLRRKLKSEQLEQYGESFIPEFVYKAIQPLPAFASMRVCCHLLLIEFPANVFAARSPARCPGVPWPDSECH